MKAVAWPQTASADVIALETDFQNIQNDLNNADQNAALTDVQQGRERL
jgi:hypothetical protein